MTFGSEKQGGGIGSVGVVHGISFVRISIVSLGSIRIPFLELSRINDTGMCKSVSWLRCVSGLAAHATSFYQEWRRRMS